MILGRGSPRSVAQSSSFVGSSSATCPNTLELFQCMCSTAPSSIDSSGGVAKYSPSPGGSTTFDRSERAGAGAAEAPGGSLTRPKTLSSSSCTGSGRTIFGRQLLTCFSVPGLTLQAGSRATSHPVIRLERCIHDIQVSTCSGSSAEIFTDCGQQRIATRQTR